MVYRPIASCKRLLAYQDAHRHHIGANASSIPVNASRCPVNQYQRDRTFAGGCPFSGFGEKRNFYPNEQGEQGAPTPNNAITPPPMPAIEDAWIGHHDLADENYYSQAGALFRLMNAQQQQQLAKTIAEGLRGETFPSKVDKVAQFEKADTHFAQCVKKALGNQ